MLSRIARPPEGAVVLEGAQGSLGVVRSLSPRSALSGVEYFNSLRGPLEFAAMTGDDPLPGCADFPLPAGGALKGAM